MGSTCFTVETTSFLDEEQVAGRYEEAKAIILPQLTDLIEARAEVMAQITTAEAQIEELGVRQDKLLAEAEDLKDEAVTLAQTGGNPLKVNAKRRAKEGEAADIAQWIQDLQDLVTVLVGRGRDAHAAVFNAWKLAEEQYRGGVQEKFNNMHRALSEYHSAYLPGMERVYTEIMQPDNFGRFGMTHATLQGRKSVARLRMDLRSSVYGILDRHGHRLLGTILG